MQKQAPTLPRLLLMAGFALSCFGLILFLWVAFGGPVPLAAKGYQVKVDFINAGQLASQADVRISGVPVGKVAKVELGPSNATRATLQIEPRYAPIPADSRAILRTKTLLGETYVELTPGNRANGKPLGDGAMLPASQVRQQVTIDRIFQTFDAKTRKGFQDWQQYLAGALAGRGGDISNAFGNLPAFTDSANRALEVLNSEGDALKRMVRDTGVVFNALSERDTQLQQSIVNSNTVFSTTAKLNQQLADVFTVLPTFETESTQTLNQLKDLAASGEPLMQQLIPAARQITPTLQGVQKLSKPLNQVLTTLKPTVDASANGVPALDKFLNGNGAQPGLSKVLGGPDSLDRFLNQLNPMIAYLGAYKREIPSFFANATAVTQGADNLATPFSLAGVHYIRAATTLNPLSLAAFEQRPSSNRTTPYFTPDGSLSSDPDIPSNELPRLPRTYELKSYLTAQCGGSVKPKAPTSASAADRPDPVTPKVTGAVGSKVLTIGSLSDLRQIFGGSSVTGVGIPANTKVMSVDAATVQVTLNNAITQTLSDSDATFLWDPDPFLVTAIRAMAFGGTVDSVPAPACTVQPKLTAPAAGYGFNDYGNYSGLFPQLAAQGSAP